MRNLDLTCIEVSGLHLIEASAGTGKTWTIAALYVLLLLEGRLRPEEILVVTYTKAATAELRDRIRTRVRDTLDLFATGRDPGDDLESVLLGSRAMDRALAQKLLTRALYSFDDAAIYTIHGFCQRALQDNAFESGSLFDTEMISDQGGIVREACDDFWRTRILGEPDGFLEQLVREGYTPEKLAAPFRGHYQNPGLTVIPAAGDPDLALLTERRNRLFERLAPIWHTERDLILAAVSGSGLKQTSYRPEQVSAAAGALDSWFRAGHPQQICTGLRLFTTDALQKGQKKGSTLPCHPFFELCQEMHDICAQVAGAFREKVIHRRTALFEWLKTELTRRKRSRNLRCYDDLLLDLHRTLTGGDGERLGQSLRGRYRAALIDEFQDTDPLQWQIFSRLAGCYPKPVPATVQDDGDSAAGAASYPLYLIGDPKQAIYSFRGADIFAYIDAASAVDVEMRSTLDTNRRSTGRLVAAVNRLFGGSDDPFLCSSIEFKPVRSGRPAGHGLLKYGQPLTEPLQFWVLPRSDQSSPLTKPEACRTIVRCVAREIARLLDGSFELIDQGGRRPVRPGDIAVLVKAHYQAELVQEELGCLGIPSVQRGSATIFESVEALDLLRIMRAAHEPGRERLVREALLTATMGICADEVAGYLDRAGDDRGWEEWLLRFRGLNTAAREGGVISMAERLLGECGVRMRALSRSGGERTLTNVMHCVELLHRAEQEHVSGLEGLIVWLEHRIAREEEDEAALLRLETDADAVQLSTIHASKGLEYPVVFLPFAWDSPSGSTDQVIFHDEHGRLTLDLGSGTLEESKHKARAERDAEAARLLYVSVTRAEFLCCIAWGSINDAGSSPLFPLLHGDGGSLGSAKSFKACTDQDILEDIRRLATPEAGITACLMPLDAASPPYRPAQAVLKPLTCRSLPRAIPADWRVSSFSSLTSAGERSLQPRDYDTLAATAADRGGDQPGARATAWSIHEFPRGASAGTCLHEILERLDYSALTAEQIRSACSSRLRANGYQDGWLGAVTGMVTTLTGAQLIGEVPHFSLSQLQRGSWQTEMEFFLPVAQLSAERLRDVFDGFLLTEQHGDFAAVLASLSFQQSRGMLQGFMDLVFHHAGRYYIVDWKSNHLGFSDSDYTSDAMTDAMVHHAYILQYHLYALALHRHLKRCIPGYDYATHFGGAIYVFLRGLSRDDRQRGIYRDTPPAAFIERAERLLLG